MMAHGVLVLLLLISAVTYIATEIALDFRVTPPTIVPKSNRNMTISCRASSYNHRENAIYGFKILKNYQNGWKVLVEVTDLSPLVTVQDASVSDWGGSLTRDKTQSGYLYATWSKQSSDKFGRYLCVASTFHEGNNRIETKRKTLNIGHNFVASDLLLIMKQDKMEVEEKFEDFSKKTKVSQENLQKKTRQDVENFQRELSQYNNQLKDFLIEETKKFEKVKGELVALINTLQVEHAKKTEEINSRLQAALERGFLMIWPRGSYALPKTFTGCPSSAGVAWAEGWRKHHTESTKRNKDEVSPENHLLQPALSREEGQNFVYQRFCVKTDSLSPGPTWPRGSYCINKYGQCPSGFEEGSVKWSEENTNFGGVSDGQLPDATFNGSDSTFYYCCRSDGPTEVPADLPRSQPFYLYRHGNVCQQLSGMNVTEEFIIFDTENLDSSDESLDSNDNNTVTRLCYYQKE